MYSLQEEAQLQAQAMTLTGAGRSCGQAMKAPCLLTSLRIQRQIVPSLAELSTVSDEHTHAFSEL